MRISMLAALLGLLICTAGAAAPPAAKTHTVKIDATRFEPAALTVAPGDTVVWLNEDLFPHTATSTAGLFDSKEIKPGTSWRYIVPKKGFFDYVCTFHPAMRGSLRVR